MNYILVVILLFVGVIESIRHRKLTVAGAIAGGIIGFCIFIGSGWTGLALLGIFFLLGTMATSWRRKQKSELGMMQEADGQRTLGQVLANGGAGGILGLLALLFPEQRDVFTLMTAGAFSAATADTLSSELGSIYGKKFYNIIGLKKDQRGLDGVVSLEGTLVGILGSVIIGVIYSIGFGWSNHFFWIVAAGTIGNLADSILGAALERKRMINNNTVNFSNTVIGALFAWLFSL